jgi:hypothetical protein
VDDPARCQPFAAEMQTETVENFAGPQPDDERRTLEDTAGISTGVAFDLHRQIEKRRAQQAVRPEKLSPDIPIARVVQVSMVAGCRAASVCSS